ncbi:helix-turn-helix domain-containing protein [Actinospica robiniae]|uniref:helix-turn-helix domain-containing protein n=1 Tax=Actinospica robiniae TaxID=304901 RepID=UPI000419BBE3|nr:helix-turn-helix transcriptional regulator [Actinospica robiniae]
MTDLHLGPVRLAQLGAYIREQRESAQYSLRQLASAAGVSNPYLSQIERGLRKPSADVLQQLARALQISAETMYIRAGLLDGEQDTRAERGEEADRAAAGGVLAAITADPHLTTRQKSALREIYLSFRGQEGGTTDEHE